MQTTKPALTTMRHGLTGQTVLMPTEDIAPYTAFIKKAFAELKPVGFFEDQAVQTIADTHWRLNRGRAYEASLFSHHTDATEPETSLTIAKSLASLSTYEQRLTRTLQQAKNELAELQKARQDHDAAQLHSAINLHRYHRNIETEWQPADFGFVFTTTELDAHIRRNTSREKADYYCIWHDLRAA